MMKTEGAAACMVGAAMLTILVSVPAMAQNGGHGLKTKEAADKFSQQNAICGANAAFLSICDKKNREFFDKMGREFILRAYMSGIMAGLYEQTLSKRFDAAGSQISAETQKNCDHIGVVLERHEKICKAFFEAGPSSSQMTAKSK